jgi:mono/diheme cytochrome c family protein
LLGSVLTVSLASMGSAQPAAVAQTPAVVARTPAPSVLTGAYTEEQALRGQALYNATCSSCHGETMAGLDQAPPLVGPQFASVWDGAPLAALVARIGTMPPENPGKLSRADHVDILAYVLWYNGLPLGAEPLGNEQGDLSKIKFETPPLPSR